MDKDFLLKIWPEDVAEERLQEQLQLGGFVTRSMYSEGPTWRSLTADQLPTVDEVKAMLGYPVFPRLTEPQAQAYMELFE